jgi:transposase
MFGDDVVRGARDRDPAVTVERIANDFGVDPMTLFKRLRQAEVEEGLKPGESGGESAQLREVRGGSSCWSRRTRCCAGRRRTCRRRIFRGKLYPLVSEPAAAGSQWR